jgi:aspartate aminotransferase
MEKSLVRQPAPYINLNIRGLRPSATLAINQRSRELEARGDRVFRLGLGQSPFPVPPPVVEELRANAFQKDYLAVEGLSELREAVADYHRRSQGIACTASDVLIAPGSKELMFLLQLVYYGDLLIPTPSWVSYAPQARIIGRQVHWLPTAAADQWMLTADELARFCEFDREAPRIVILNYPSNPTGATYSEQQLGAIAEVARQHRIVLLSDEIYGELHHQGKHVSIARFYPEGTIVSSGLSKWCGAGGWRLGTFTFPTSLAWLREAMAAVASETYTSTSAPIQYAAVRAFRGGLEIERYLVHSRRILSALGHLTAARLEALGLEVTPPAGGFYLFPDFSAHKQRLQQKGIRSSTAMCNSLLEQTGVALLPGSAFGRPADELTARLAYVDFDGARALAAAEGLPPETDLEAEFCQTFCPKVLEAIDRIGQWLEA